MIRSNEPQTLNGQTVIQTSRKGSADLFLGKDADCRMARPTTRGTRLRTRYPYGAMFSQSKGKTLCTFSGDFGVDVLGAKIVRSRALAAVVSSLAIVKTLEPETQFRIAYDPLSSLDVSVRRGQLGVTLRNGRYFQLGQAIDPATELIVSLDPRGHIISTDRRIPFFPSPDDIVFATQGKQIG